MLELTIFSANFVPLNSAITLTLAPFDPFATPSDNLDLNQAFHTLLQQALVQSPHVYLTALAAMKTNQPSDDIASKH